MYQPTVSSKLFGIFPARDSRTYVIAIVVLTVILVVLSQLSGSLAVGLALTALFAIAITTMGK